LSKLEDFDWQFNPSIKKKQIFDLASCRFIRECRELSKMLSMPKKELKSIENLI